MRFEGRSSDAKARVESNLEGVIAAKGLKHSECSISFVEGEILLAITLKRRSTARE